MDSWQFGMPIEGWEYIFFFAHADLVVSTLLLVLVETLSAVATTVGLMDNAAELIRRRCIGNQQRTQGGLENKAH